MEIEQAFARVMVPGAFSVLGIRLQPLSLGHAMLLQRLGSPFGAGDRAPGRGDLALALFVCSRPWQRAERQIERWWVRWWLKTVPAWGLHWRVGMVEFARYWEWFNREPEIEIWHGPPGTEKLAAPPFLQTLKVWQMVHCGKSREQALNTPLNECIWDFVTAGVSEGKLQLKTREQGEIIEQVKRLKAEAAAKAAMSNDQCPMSK